MPNKRKLKNILLFPVLGISIVALLFALSSTSRMTVASALSPTMVYLPVISVSYPPQTVFGVELNQLTIGGGLNQLSATKAGWTRRNGLLWSDVEPAPGVRNWSALATLESELINASNSGLQTILIVRGTPSWAQLYAGYSCGPIKDTALDAFGNFMRAVVARYSYAPYNVKYWEIWNEPDIDHSLVGPDSDYGCWGNNSDTYYGGAYYGRMLQVVYPQVKAANPSAQVLVGGLLLDCDPRGPCTASLSNIAGSTLAQTLDPHSPNAPHNSPIPPMFLEGILVGGGGPYFDGVSFHAYDYYEYALGHYDNPNWNSAWNTTGPVATAKASFIKSIMAKHNVTGKSLMNTEVGLIYDGATNSDFETTKAYYVGQAYVEALVQGLRASTWYSLYGWRNSGLLDSSGNPLPAYNAFKFSASELQDVQAASDLALGPGIKGVELNKPRRRIWAIWSLDGTSHSITLPSVPAAIYSTYGTALGVTTSPTVGLQPIYVEWSP